MRTVYIGLFMIISCIAKGQGASGYYITLTNDTVYATYNVKRNLFKGYDLYIALPTIDSNMRTNKFEPTDIKGFYVQMKDEAATFVSMPMQNFGRRHFLRILELSPKLNVYEYSEAYKARTSMNFILQKSDSSFLFIKSSMGNIKSRKALREFFAGDDTTLTAMKGLFVQPGFTERDMRTFLQRIFEDFKTESLFIKQPYYLNELPDY